MNRETFHHGDLSPALLELAERELKTSGYEDLSLRSLAKQLGVSQTAPYRHFKDRSAFLAALSECGGKRLHESYLKAIAQGQTHAQRLRLVCASYIRFALSEPEMFRLIYAVNAHGSESVLMEQLASFRLFMELVGTTHELTDPKERQTAAFTCWSTLHGYVMLRLSGLAMQQAFLEEIEDSVIAVACTYVPPSGKL